MKNEHAKVPKIRSLVLECDKDPTNSNLTHEALSSSLEK